MRRLTKELTLSGRLLDAYEFKGRIFVIPYPSETEFVRWLLKHDIDEIYRYAVFQGEPISLLLKRLNLTNDADAISRASG